MRRAFPLFRRAAAVAALAAVPGCVVAGDDAAHVVVSLDLGVLELPTDELPGPRDENGLVRLDRVPAYVLAVVTGPGLEAPLVASWPDRDPLTPRAIVRFSLDVPVGPQRHFAFLAYVRRTGEVRTWQDDGTIVRDLLEGGTSSELDVTLHGLSRGTVAGTLVGPRAADVAAVLVVDGDPARAEGSEGPGVAWPPAPVDAGAFEVADLPVGHALSFAVQWADGSVARSAAAPVTLTTADERRDVVVTVP